MDLEFLSCKGQGHLSDAGEKALSGAPRMSNVMKCSYKGCRRPCESRKFHVINGESESGGQDWTQLAGSVLCDACHAQYSKRGTLERSQVQHEPLVGYDRRCSYEGCRRPTMGQHIQIYGASKAGGQDWTALAGRVLCNTCRQQYATRGTLERLVQRGDPLTGDARRCSYTGCKRPHKSTRFNQVDGRSTAGGQDWSALSGQVLCDACYQRFLKRGSLEHAEKGRQRAKEDHSDNHLAPLHQGNKRKAAPELGPEGDLKHATTRSSTSKQRSIVSNNSSDVCSDGKDQRKVWQRVRAMEEAEGHPGQDGLLVLSNVLEMWDSSDITGK